MLSKKDFIAYLFRPQIKGHLRIHRIGLEIHREINCDDGIDTHARLNEILSRYLLWYYRYLLYSSISFGSRTVITHCSKM